MPLIQVTQGQTVILRPFINKCSLTPRKGWYQSSIISDFQILAQDQDYTVIPLECHSTFHLCASQLPSDRPPTLQALYISHWIQTTGLLPDRHAESIRPCSNSFQ